MTQAARADYLMESAFEPERLEKKTDPAETRRQLLLVGVEPGQRVLDAGGGTGAVSRVIPARIPDTSNAPAEAPVAILLSDQQIRLEPGSAFHVAPTAAHQPTETRAASRSLVRLRTVGLHARAPRPVLGSVGTHRHPLRPVCGAGA